MGKEIERKYLVDNARLGPLLNGIEITQGYISARKNAVVRVRQAADKAWLTLKGPNDGAVRTEFEYEIPPADARQMIEEFCAGQLIAKTRYLREYRGYLWEVDVFAGQNAGLVVAEVELSSPQENPPLPPWVGAEVTADTRYFNNSLYTYPYCEWDTDTGSSV